MRTKPPLKWALPEVVHPDKTRCFQILIPDDPGYIGAFYGAMYLLSKPYAWENDPAHTALEVGAVMRDVFDQLIFHGACQTPPADIGGLLEDFEMPLRVDCDCNVFVTCCDGTEKQILTADQIQLLLASQPGSGTPTIPPGGCQTIHGTMGARDPWYLPALVSDGDTIEVMNTDGGWNDGDLSRWWCGDGQRFVGNACVGLEEQLPGDPLPTANHMCIIALINGSYYDVSHGPLTVPSGISNQQVLLLANDSAPSDNSGTQTFDVQVCNNQPAAWSHEFDFALTTLGWQVRDHGQWTAGLGWQSVLIHTSDYKDELEIEFLNATAFTLTRFAVQVDATLGAGSANIGLGRNTPGTYFVLTPILSGLNTYDSGAVSLGSTTNLYIDGLVGEGGSDPGGLMTIGHVSVSGLGFDPFV